MLHIRIMVCIRAQYWALIFLLEKLIVAKMKVRLQNISITGGDNYDEGKKDKESVNS